MAVINQMLLYLLLTVCCWTLFRLILSSLIYCKRHVCQPTEGHLRPFVSLPQGSWRGHSEKKSSLTQIFVLDVSSPGRTRERFTITHNISGPRFPIRPFPLCYGRRLKMLFGMHEFFWLQYFKWPLEYIAMSGILPLWYPVLITHPWSHLHNLKLNQFICDKQ